MKFSIIGTGFIMPRHVEAIEHINGQIVDIVNDFRDQDQWKEVVARPEPDCIVILTPNDLHFEMALAATENNKIVLCEKPLAISSGQIKILAGKPNVFTVLQLRYHPTAEQLKREISRENKYEIEMDISVHRNERYYQIWKGQKERSGGLLFNLGIHYFDMLLYLFGPAKKVSTESLNNKTGTGIIEGDNYVCRWRMSTDEKRNNQKRVFKINGVNYNFSSQDNLSYENLHRFVYQNLLKGEGMTPDKVLESTELIERLYHKS